MRLIEEMPHHVSGIKHVIDEAFGGGAESTLISNLRDDGDLALSLLAEADDGSVIGHIALSRLISPDGALALAPLSVIPSSQRRGIGAALVREALRLARLRNDRVVFVFGDAAYYERFGFSRDLAAHYPCRYGGEHFLALSLVDHPPPAADVIYPPAFDLLG